MSNNPAKEIKTILQAGQVPIECALVSRACHLLSQVFTKHLFNKLLQKFPETNVRFNLHPFF